MDVKSLAENAKRQMGELTGLKPITVTGISRDDQGWHISMDMLEMSRIPNSTDVLGNYEVILDEMGNMQKFQRKAIRLRGEPVEKMEWVR